jgi:hypothetical protein
MSAMPNAALLSMVASVPFAVVGPAIDSERHA